MGILDDAKMSISRGTAAAERTAKTLAVKNRINEIQKRRRDLAAQLGASLYEATKDKDEFREGREGIYDAISSCDAERDDCQRQIEQLEAESKAAQQVSCPNCGARISASDSFCWGCGKPVDKDLSASESREPTSLDSGAAKCERCNSPVAAGDLFCMRCGAKIDGNQKAVHQE